MSQLPLSYVPAPYFLQGLELLRRRADGGHNLGEGLAALVLGRHEALDAAVRLVTPAVPCTGGGTGQHAGPTGVCRDND